ARIHLPYTTLFRSGPVELDSRLPGVCVVDPIRRQLRVVPGRPAAIGKAGNPPIHIAFGYNMLRCLHKPRPIGITNMARELITGHLSSFLKCESQGFKNGLRRRSLGEYFPDLLKDRTAFFVDVN